MDFKQNLVMFVKTLSLLETCFKFLVNAIYTFLLLVGDCKLSFLIPNKDKNWLQLMR